MHISIDKNTDVCTFMTFNGGEEHCVIDTNALPEHVDDDNPIQISLFNPTSSNLIRLMMVTKALRDQFTKQCNMELFIPYFPGARQDRMNDVNDQDLVPLSAKYYAEFINSLGFQSVKIVDPHSDVTPAVIDYVIPYTHKDIFAPEIMSIDYAGPKLFLFPDAGAAKKYEKQYSRYGDIEFCTKKRDMKTGKLSDTVVPDLSRYRDSWIFIIDDICDGGRTFLNIAEKTGKLAKQNTILCVTHGIFLQGVSLMCDTFYHVITTNSVKDMRMKEWGEQRVHRNLTEIDLYNYFNLENE